jgi:flagellar biosynthesis/type III secretory pathway protein FliH
MSHIIKSEHAAKIAAFRGISQMLPPRISAVEEERDRLQRRVAQLEAEISERDTRIITLKDEIERALERGRAEGHESGIAEAEQREAERLESVVRGMSRANADFKDSLQSLERLSTLLARDCLEIMLADPDYRSETVAKIIRAHLSGVERSSLIALTVSTADFPDAASLESLALRTGLDSSLLTSAELAEGDCNITLRLGSHEIGINQQWSVLSKRLTALSEPSP